MKNKLAELVGSHHNIWWIPGVIHTFSSYLWVTCHWFHKRLSCHYIFMPGLNMVKRSANSNQTWFYYAVWFPAVNGSMRERDVYNWNSLILNSWEGRKPDCNGVIKNWVALQIIQSSNISHYNKLFILVMARQFLQHSCYTPQLSFLHFSFRCIHQAGFK